MLRPLAVVGLVVAVAGCSGGASHVSRPPATAPPKTTTTMLAPAVPASYQARYDQLSPKLDEFASAVGRAAPLATTRPVQATELLSANGNRLTALLQPNTMTGVDRELEALKHAGVKGVTLGIKLPMLDPQYEPKATQYSSFYGTVAQHARAHGMAIDVELGALFCGTVFAQCSYRWPTTIDGFADLTARQAQTVIDVVKPDYLTILAEPTTEAQLTKIQSFTTAEGAADYVRRTLAGIDHRGSTKLGAGAGTWSPVSFARAIVTTPVDYLDTHVYPVGAAVASTLIGMAQVAHDAHKPLVIDELWLYKSAAGAANNGVAQAAGENQLNRFSFWTPLDVRFLSAMRAWAASAGVVYESAFRSINLFFAQEWTPTLEQQSFAQGTVAFNRGAVAAMQGGTTTPLAPAWTGVSPSTP